MDRALIDRIRRIAYRRVRWSDRWEDVAQRACLMALTRPDTTPALLVLDAIRLEFGRHRRSVAAALARMTLLEHPERIAGRYATPAELAERWVDEANEDLAEEWAGLSYSERDARVRESDRSLGCSRA